MKSPAFQFYPSDWLSDIGVRSLSVEARGVWIDLICLMHQADPYGHLAINGRPFTIEELSRIIGIKSRRFSLIFDEIFEKKCLKIVEKNGQNFYYSSRMVKDGNDRQNWRERKQREREKVRDVTGGVTQLSLGSSSPSSSSERERVFQKNLSLSGEVSPDGDDPQPKQKKATRLPKDWSPSEALMAWMKKERPDLAVAQVVAAFRDHWQAIPGKDGLKLDWEATFRNWVRREKSAIGPGKLQSSGNQKPAPERIKDAFVDGKLLESKVPWLKGVFQPETLKPVDASGRVVDISHAYGLAVNGEVLTFAQWKIFDEQ